VTVKGYWEMVVLLVLVPLESRGSNSATEISVEPVISDKISSINILSARAQGEVDGQGQHASAPIHLTCREI
jgi:hypothetical protein